MKPEMLMEMARQAAEMAYAPYSGFRVGAALLSADGKVFTGCNIENAAFGPTNCAERTSFFKAVSEGCREFSAIAVYGGEGKKLVAPCGVCRQVMREFCKDDFAIYLTDGKNLKAYTLAELLPYSFSPENLCE